MHYDYWNDDYQRDISLLEAFIADAQVHYEEQVEWKMLSSLKGAMRELGLEELSAAQPKYGVAGTFERAEKCAAHGHRGAVVSYLAQVLGALQIQHLCL